MHRAVLRLSALLFLWTGLQWAGLLVQPARAGEVLDAQFRSVEVPQNTVPTLAQDRSGFIWVATIKGLTRYDGYRLRPVEQEGPTAARRNLGWVRALAPARDGRMWIGTEFQGLMVYDPQQDRVQALGSAEGREAAHVPIRALAEDGDGSVWMGSLGQGLQRYLPAERRFERHELSIKGEKEQRITALVVGHDGTVWAGHWRGLARRQGAGWVPVDLPGPQDEATVLALTEDRAGRVWFGTQDGRLGVVEQGRARWVQDLKAPVQALAEAEDGRIWVGGKKGLYWLDPNRGSIEAWLRHDPRHLRGLAGNDISGLLRDRWGVMWVSGYGLGLQRHQDHPALAVRGPDNDAQSPLRELDVRALLRLHNGEVLAPTQLGPVVRLDGRPGQALATLGAWPRERRSVVDALNQAPDGSLWLASAGRLEHRSLDGRLLRDWPLEGARAQQLLIRRTGEVWLGMQEGLYRLASPEAPALQRVTLAGGEALKGGIYVLREEPGTQALWVGGQQGLFVEGAGGLVPLAQSPKEALGSPIVMGLLWSRDGTLWVDTPVSGLHRRIGLDAQGRSRFERISERHEVQGVFGGNLHEDSQGRIWSQLYVYDPRADRIDAFGPAEGAFFGSFWFFASCDLPGGGLLFGGSRGLLRVQPEAYAPPTGELPMVISGLRLNGQPFHPQSLQQGLTLQPGMRTLTVEFAGLDYADPQRLRYQYRLLGQDTEWTRVDASARSPSFGPLKPGRYVLQMRAMPQQGAGRMASLDLPIELLPAWWQTWWARFGAGVLLLLSIWSWVQWRTRRLRHREVELRALVDARTVELREASLTDTLTGLRNRRYLALRLEDDLNLCLRRFESEGQEPGPDSDLLLMLLDLDHFKRVNDVHGHGAGDAVLVQLAERLRKVFRGTDSLVRWGGEEVLVLVRDSNRGSAAELAERACTAVRERLFDIGEGRQIPVTVSLGWTAFPLDPSQPRAWDWDASLGLTDAALYAAKAQGRDGHVGIERADGLTPLHLPKDWWLGQPPAGLTVRRSRTRFGG